MSKLRHFRALFEPQIQRAKQHLEYLLVSASLCPLPKDLDVLTTDLRGIPDRHRSMSAVFESSWQLMRPEEQTTFMQLVVFRGGFTREAAVQVTGTSLWVLSDLVDKSLLRLSTL